MHALLVATATLACVAAPAAARSAGDPIKLVWSEGDVAGATAIYAPDDDARRESIGLVEYHQRREGNQLTAVRVARFRDGSSDEDAAVARVDGELTALSGRSIIRDTDGETLVDVRIDVANGRLQATWGRGSDKSSVDRKVELPAGTYWGPLIFIVLKNFEANAEDGRLVFRTVAPTPRPIVLDLEMTRGDTASIERDGIRMTARDFVLRPTVHWSVDPLVQWLVAPAHLWTLPGEPPGLVRFTGPRNYRRQSIVIE